MKKIAAILFASLAFVSFGSNAYFTLEGKSVEVPKPIFKYCATASDYWRCVESAEIIFANKYPSD